MARIRNVKAQRHRKTTFKRTAPVADAGHRKSIQEEKKLTFAEKKLQERVDFERLIASISARFLAISSDSLDSEIKAVQQQLCEFLGLDVCAIWQVSADNPGSLTMTYLYVVPDVPFTPPVTLDAAESFPWCLKKVMKKEGIILSRLSDAPAEARRDVEAWQSYGIKSALTLPLVTVGDAVVGCLSFNSLQEGWAWSIDLLTEMQLIAQIFANALNRKAGERNLKESETRYRMLFESVPAGVVMIGMDGHIRTANSAQARMYGYDSPQQLEGMYTPLLIAEKDRERAAQNMRNQLAGRDMPDWTYTAVRRDGSEFFVEVSAAFMLGSEGRPEGYVCISRDITKIKEDEGEMALLRLELTHLSRVMTMSELSASLAHEINQPLGAILNNASAARLLLDQVRDKPADVAGIVEDIIRDAKRAGDVVRKIRGMLKKGDVQFEPLQINTLIEEIVGLFQNTIRGNKAALFLDLMPGLPKVNGDRVHLQQVLLNLLTNALEAMKESPGKLLTISSFLRQLDTVTVTVSDTGVGVNEAVKDLVFKPFFTTKNDGLGFGLAICRSIIEEHGGKIWIENNPQGGATVLFSLKSF